METVYLCGKCGSWVQISISPFPGFVLGYPEFNSLACTENSQLICLLLDWMVNHLFLMWSICFIVCLRWHWKSPFRGNGSLISYLNYLCWFCVWLVGRVWSKFSGPFTGCNETRSIQSQISLHTQTKCNFTTKCIFAAFNAWNNAIQVQAKKKWKSCLDTFSYNPKIMGFLGRFTFWSVSIFTIKINQLSSIHKKYDITLVVFPS